MLKSIVGVRFINTYELTFVDRQRAKYPHIQWNFSDNLPLVKPSASWFSGDYTWLRAICTEGQYGLLCIDCAEFASDAMAIGRSQGAFVVRPYWKLKRKGLEGKNMNFYSSI